MKYWLKNPWWWSLFFLLTFWITVLWLSVKPIKKLIVKIFAEECRMEINKIKPELSEKIYLIKDTYYSKGYSINVKDEEKIITTAGIIYVLKNGNVIHLIATGENIKGRIKNTEETIDFLIKHQDEILDDLIKTIVEAGQRSPEPKFKKEKQFPNDKAIKKKV